MNNVENWIYNNVFWETYQLFWGGITFVMPDDVQSNLESTCKIDCIFAIFQKPLIIIFIQYTWFYDSQTIGSKQPLHVVLSARPSVIPAISLSVYRSTYYLMHSNEFPGNFLIIEHPAPFTYSRLINREQSHIVKEHFVMNEWSFYYPPPFP